MDGVTDPQKKDPGRLRVSCHVNVQEWFPLTVWNECVLRPVTKETALVCTCVVSSNTAL